MCLLIIVCGIVFYYLDKHFNQIQSRLHLARFITCVLTMFLLACVLDADEVISFIRSSDQAKDRLFERDFLQWFEYAFGWIFLLAFLSATFAEWPQYRWSLRYEALEAENEQLREALSRADGNSGGGSNKGDATYYEKVPTWKRVQNTEEKEKVVQTIYCPDCGTGQRNDRTVCYQCGRKLGE